MQRTEDVGWETYSVQKIVSVQLLALIEEQAVYKIILSSEDFQYADVSLLVRNWIHRANIRTRWLTMCQLWVFTSDLLYSTSTRPTQRAMKVFYKRLADPLADVKNSTKVEEIQLPGYALSEIEANLQESTKVLPQSARKYQDWAIGLLDR